MYRFIIPLLVALFFLPLTLHAQKEDFQPPKVHQKSIHVKKTATKKKKEVKSTTKIKVETKAASVKADQKQVSEKTTVKNAEKTTVKKAEKTIVKKTEKSTAKKTGKEVAKPARKVERQKVAAPKDSTPTPGFIRYIPKTRDINP